MHYLMIEYLNIIDDGEDISKHWLNNNKYKIKHELGSQVLKECILNYRIKYLISRANIFNIIIKYISVKKIFYKSDLAIVSNYIDNYKLKSDEKIIAYDLLMNIFNKYSDRVNFKRKNIILKYYKINKLLFFDEIKKIFEKANYENLNN